MPKTDRVRIDYMPGCAAVEALHIASERFPALRTQALIDKLLICGLSALVHQHWKPPMLYGKSREGWRLPDCLIPEELDKLLIE
jgi:hypothetical protein